MPSPFLIFIGDRVLFLLTFLYSVAVLTLLFMAIIEGINNVINEEKHDE